MARRATSTGMGPGCPARRAGVTFQTVEHNAGQPTWDAAVTEAAVRDDLHFHDLRHAGNTLAAGSGASLRELMAHMGHSSPRAALIYQHATKRGERAIGDFLGGLIERRTEGGGGTGRAPRLSLMGHVGGTPGHDLQNG